MNETAIPWSNVVAIVAFLATFAWIFHCATREDK